MQRSDVRQLASQIAMSQRVGILVIGKQSNNLYSGSRWGNHFVFCVSSICHRHGDSIA